MEPVMQKDKGGLPVFDIEVWIGEELFTPSQSLHGRCVEQTCDG